ncbi:MAG: hypothetical protein LDL33_13635 [Desulfomonile sp.]|nr:hypothetical protein [Desulfomonile sp.]
MVKITREVTAMEEKESARIAVSGESFGAGEIGGLSSSERTNLDCYEQCMNDAYDLNNEAFCASVCGFEV